MSIDSLIKKALSKQPMIKPSRTKKRAQVTTWRECSTFPQQQCRVIALGMGFIACKLTGRHGANWVMPKVLASRGRQHE